MWKLEYGFPGLQEFWALVFNLQIVISFSFCSPLVIFLGLTSYHIKQKPNIYKNRVTQGRGVLIFHLKYFFFTLCPLFSDRSIKSFLGSQLLRTFHSRKIHT